jgi:protein O-GlcNAc transferase
MSEVTRRIAEAESYEEIGQWRDALRVWRALADEGGDTRFVLRGALAAENAGLLEEAEQYFREATARAPERADGYFGLGTLLTNQGRLDEARQALGHGVNLEEQQFAVTILGVVQRRLGDLEAARATLRRSLELDPNDDEAHFALGLAIARTEPLEAIEHFRRALDLDPHLPYVHRELGQTLWKVGQYDEAETVLRQALAEDASDAWAHNYLGHLLGLADDWSRAKHEFVDAVRYLPDVGMFWRSLADACAMLGERQEADRHYLKALSLGVDDPYTNARYGVFLKAQGHLERARGYLRRALDLDPNQKQAREVLGELDDAQ